MNKKIVHVGLDVDDTKYHGAALNKATGELLNFKCRPTLKGLFGYCQDNRLNLVHLAHEHI